MLRVAFLDRDGTINADHGYVHTWDQWEFLDGAISALRSLQVAGYRSAVVSNQSGVGRGLFTLDQVGQLHNTMRLHLARRGVTIDTIAICPHLPEDDCQCRKPQRGLADVVERSLESPINYAQSWMIGDKPSDVEFARRIGTSSALIRSRYWDDDTLDTNPDLIGESLYDVVQVILSDGEPL